MNLLSKEELRSLMEKPGGWCVSIFMPTHRVSPDTKQDPIRFKNLLREAEARLKTAGPRSPDAKKLLKPAQPLVPDTLFWQHQSDGLAAFLIQSGSSTSACRSRSMSWWWPPIGSISNPFFPCSAAPGGFSFWH